MVYLGGLNSVLGSHRGAVVAKVRAVIQTKRDGNAEGQDGDLYFLPWCCLTATFFRYAGRWCTMAALARRTRCSGRGKPSVVLPFIFEQQLWARRLRQVGAAGKFVSFWKATPEGVANEIRQTLGPSPCAARRSNWRAPWPQRTVLALRRACWNGSPRTRARIARS